VIFQKHWGYKKNKIYPKYVNIYCPTLHNYKVSCFADTIGIVRELKKLEIEIKKMGFKGWLTWTKLENAHIMKYLTKLGAYPYGIDVKHNAIWFWKEIQNV